MRTSSSFLIGRDLTLYLALSSLERWPDMRVYLMWEGEAKCAFLYFLLDEVTSKKLRKKLKLDNERQYRSEQNNNSKNLWYQQFCLVLQFFSCIILGLCYLVNYPADRYHIMYYSCVVELIAGFLLVLNYSYFVHN